MVLYASSVSACSCAENPGVEVALEQSDVVFSGKVGNVIEKKQANGFLSKSVLFDVIHNWKGVENTQIIIATGLGGGDCGFYFIEGEEYLVYAYESTMYGSETLEANICSRTSKLSLAQEDLTVLGEGELPQNEVDLSSLQKSQLYYSPGFIIISIIILLIAFWFLVRKIFKGGR